MKQFVQSLFACSIIMATSSPLIAADGEYLTYPEFIAAVEDGSVKSVSIDRLSSITGMRTIGAQQRRFKSHAEIGSVNDVLLMRLLKQKGVDVEPSPIPHFGFDTTTVIIGLLTVVLPFITLLVIILVNMKVSRMRKEITALKQLLSNDSYDERSEY